MFVPLKSIAAFRAVVLVLCVAAIGGCSLNTDVSGPSSIVISTGNQQSGPPNTTLPLPLSLIVVNQFGEPLENITVTWSIDAGGGSISATSSVTDVAGKASVSYTTGPTAGNAIVRAHVHGLPPVSFTAVILSS